MMLTWPSTCKNRSSVASTVRRDKVLIVSCSLTLEMDCFSCHVRIDGEGCPCCKWPRGCGRKTDAQAERI
jgi:hypothetical protein